MNEQVFWSPGVTLEMIEKQVILMAFRFYRGNKTQCSISLGINVRTLERKLEDYDNAAEKQRETERREADDRDAQLKRARGVVRNADGTSQVSGTFTGVQVEPTTQAPPQHAVPVPKPQEVQKVLPAKSAASGERGRR